MNLTVYLKTFWWDHGNVSSCDILILYNKSYQHLEDLHNTVNQSLPNDQLFMLQHHVWVKRSFQSYDRPVNFKMAEYRKCVDTASDYCNESLRYCHVLILCIVWSTVRCFLVYSLVLFVDCFSLLTEKRVNEGKDFADLLYYCIPQCLE